MYCAMYMQNYWSKGHADQSTEHLLISDKRIEIFELFLYAKNE